MKHAILRPFLFDWLEQVRLSERLNGTADLIKGQAGTGGNIEKVMLAIRKIEDP